MLRSPAGQLGVAAQRRTAGCGCDTHSARWLGPATASQPSMAPHLPLHQPPTVLPCFPSAQLRCVAPQRPWSLGFLPLVGREGSQQPRQCCAALGFCLRCGFPAACCLRLAAGARCVLPTSSAHRHPMHGCSYRCRADDALDLMAQVSFLSRLGCAAFSEKAGK